MIQHSMYIGPPCFPVFNDRELSDEPVQEGDVVPFERSDNEDMNFTASASWSSDCEWYFVILPEGVALLNVYDRRGLLCRRHTFEFVEACLQSGILSRSINKPKRR